jgi:hypothetical protein
MPFGLNKITGRPGPTPRNPLERFMEKVMPEPNSGCWLWTGAISKNGYGAFDGRSAGAHRFSFEALRGSIPRGFQLDHKCRVRCCVNPWHLQVVSARENIMLGESPSALNMAKRVCKHGHPFNEENTSYDKKGRVCLACHARNQRAYELRKKNG